MDSQQRGGSPLEEARGPEAEMHKVSQSLFLEHTSKPALESLHSWAFTRLLLLSLQTTGKGSP